MKTDLDQEAYHITKNDPRIPVLVASTAIDRKTVTLCVQVANQSNRQAKTQRKRSYVSAQYTRVDCMQKSSTKSLVQFFDDNTKCAEFVVRI